MIKQRPTSALVVLSCAAFALVGCSTSTTGETGAVEGRVILPPNSDGQLQGQINTIRAVIACTGDDPLTGQPWEAEVFDIDVTNTQNIDTPGYKPDLGVFKKEGIPIGANCGVTLTAVTLDGLTECGGVGIFGPIPAPPLNGQVSITLNCITAARYGGLRVDGTFNRCMEFQQIIVSPLTANLGPPAGTITTDVWCYDPDRDDGDASVFFIQDDGDGIPPVDPSTWQSCSDVPVMFPGGLPFQYLLPCNHIEPPITFMDETSGLPNLVTPSASFPLVCNEQSDCLVIVTVSDDTFASGQTDPYGCAGRYPDGRPDYNAFSVIPTECQGDSVCGNNIVEAGEDCDYDGAAAGNTETAPVFVTATPVNTWCNATCDLIEPCTDNTTESPWNCPQTIDPQCQAIACADGENDVLACSSTNVQNGTFCDLGGGSGNNCNDDTDCPMNSGEVCDNGTCTNPGICDTGACVTPPLCNGPQDCEPATDCSTAETCDSALGCQPGTPINENQPCVDSDYGTTGVCVTGTCEATLRILVTNDDGFSAEGIDAIVDALVQSPNNQVIVCAPAANQSGSGSNTNCGSLATSGETTLSGYPATAIDGCPADAVNYALANLYTPTEQPHVTISGINEGQNVSEPIATQVSGTVGAAKTSALSGVPALASSQGGSDGIFNPSSTYDYPSGVDAVLTWLAANRAALAQGGATPMDVTNLNIPSCAPGASIRGTLNGIPLSLDSTGAFEGQDCSSTLENPPTDVIGLNNGFTTLSSVPLN